MKLVSRRRRPQPLLDHHNRKMRRVWRRDRHGFSLVELLVALAMATIVLSFALPLVSSGVRRAKADRAGYAMKQDLEQAFSLAMRERRPVILSVDTINRFYTIADRASGAVVVRRYMGPTTSEYGLTRLGATSTTTTIYPNGLASSSVELMVEVGDHRRELRLSRGGHVRVRTY